jgi:hypothetical protein
VGPTCTHTDWTHKDARTAGPFERAPRTSTCAGRTRNLTVSSPAQALPALSAAGGNMGATEVCCLRHRASGSPRPSPAPTDARVSAVPPSARRGGRWGGKGGSPRILLRRSTDQTPSPADTVPPRCACARAARTTPSTATALPGPRTPLAVRVGHQERLLLRPPGRVNSSEHRHPRWPAATLRQTPVQGWRVAVSRE